MQGSVTCHVLARAGGRVTCHAPAGHGLIILALHGTAPPLACSGDALLLPPSSGDAGDTRVRASAVLRPRTPRNTTRDTGTAAAAAQQLSL